MTDLRHLTVLEVAVLILVSALVAASLFCPSGSTIVATAGHGHLMPVVHTQHNAYFYLTSFGTWAAGDVGSNVLVLVGLMGLTAALSYHTFSPILSLTSAAIVFGANAWVFGDDFLILGPLALIPWLYLLIASEHSSNLAYLLLLSITIFSSWLVLYSLSLPVLLFVILLRSVLVTTPLPRPTSFLLFFACLLLLLLGCMSPPLPWPDYPVGARITALLDGPAWFARPMIGNDLPFPTIDRTSLVTLYRPYLLPVAGLLFAMGLRMRCFPRALNCYFLCCIGLILAFIDLRASETVAQLSPLRALPRLLPEFSFIPLVALVLGLTLAGTLLVALLTSLNSGGRLFLASLATLVALVSSTRFVPSFESTASAGWNHSPSRFVARFFSDPVLQNAQSKSKSLRLSRSEYQFRSSNADVDSNVIFDRNMGTRWSSGGAQQQGSEWLELELSSPRALLGIKLLTGEFATDFPRGLRISAGTDCTSLSPIVAFPQWQGKLSFTASGLPYFSAQSDVEVYFPKLVNAGCLRVEQIGTTPAFDWSVAELRLSVPTTEGTLEETVE